jgi:predicted RNase H-like nuclease
LDELAREGIGFDPDAERHRVGRQHVSRDDLIDAAVMFASARRVASGNAVRLGDGARDSKGLLMHMWA